MNKISLFVEKICVFEESPYQDLMEAVTRHCRETEQNDTVFIFTTEKSNFVIFQRLRYQKKRKELNFNMKQSELKKCNSSPVIQNLECALETGHTVL